MLASWKLGRVAGIDVFVHPTFLLVFLFTDVIRNGPLAILLVLAVFGCVLLHEFGHALMARRFGIETEDITLYPIGGVARLRRLPRAPGAELLIALAGPAVNFAIVGMLLLLRWVGLLDDLAETATGFFLEQMIVVNLFLGLFNLIPAFPLDGGRVLRALLSGWLGRVQATHVAASIGRGLAVLFGLSVLYTGYWIHLALAIFVYFAARAEELQVLHEERRRQYEGENQGVWVAPPGYRWVQRNDGVWQLAPIVVVQGGPYVEPSPWR